VGSGEWGCPPEGCRQERSGVTQLAVVLRMWPRCCGLNIWGSVSYQSRGSESLWGAGLGVCLPGRSMLAPSPAAPDRVVQGRCGSDLLPRHTHGFQLISHPWAMGLGQLIYWTAGTCQLPDPHCLHLRPDLLHPRINQTLLWVSAGTADPSRSPGSAYTSLLAFNPPIASLQNPTGG